MNQWIIGIQAASRDAELVNLPCSYLSTSVVGGLGNSMDGDDGAVSSSARVQHNSGHPFRTYGAVKGSLSSSRCCG